MNIEKLFTEGRMNSLLIDINNTYKFLENNNDIYIEDKKLLKKYKDEINFFYDENIVNQKTHKLNKIKYSIFRNYSQGFDFENISGEELKNLINELCKKVNNHKVILRNIGKMGFNINKLTSDYKFIDNSELQFRALIELYGEEFYNKLLLIKGKESIDNIIFLKGNIIFLKGNISYDKDDNIMNNNGDIIQLDFTNKQHIFIKILLDNIGRLCNCLILNEGFDKYKISLSNSNDGLKNDCNYIYNNIKRNNSKLLFLKDNIVNISGEGYMIN